MTNALIISQILGTLFTLVGLSMIINRKNALSFISDMTQNKGTTWACGLSALATGAIILSLNSAWSSGLVLFVTIVGWLALLKGVFLTFFPNSAASFYRMVSKDNLITVGGVVVFIVGLVLLYNTGTI